MKKISVLLLIITVFSLHLEAQVGINTPNPRSTLDVEVDPSGVKASGIIFPSVSIATMSDQTKYTAAQNNIVVYYNGTGTASGTVDVSNVVGSGYYYFAASVGATGQWETVSTTVLTSHNWLLNGNSDVDSTLMPPKDTYLGTNTKEPIIFKTNDVEQARITAAGFFVSLHDAFIHGARVGLGNGSLLSNTAVGALTMQSNTTGANSVAIGNSALNTNSTGNANTALGSSALKAATAGSNTAIGAFAGNAITTGNGNTILGSLPGTAALANTVLVGTGSSTGTAADGTEYLRIQPKASGVDPTAGINGLVGINNTNPQYALDVTGETRISNIPAGTVGANNILVSNGGIVSAVDASAILGSNPAWLLSGNAITPGAFLGTTNPQSLAIATNNINVATFTHLPLDPTQPAGQLSTVSDAIIHGLTVGEGKGSISSNTAIGASALSSNTGLGFNVAVGYKALSGTTSGTYNTALGYSAGSGNLVGVGNVSIGASALRAATGGNNMAIGTFAGNAITTGTGNTVLGSLPGTAALANTVLVGTGSSTGTTADGTEYMRIQPKTSGVDPTVGINGLVGINNTNPQYALDVTGETRISNIPAGTVGANNILVSNGGIVSAVDASAILGSSPAWKITGNATIDSTLNFLGTTIKEPIIFKTNNTEQARITGAGFLTTIHDAFIHGARVGLGGGSLVSNTTIGTLSMQNNTTGANNVAVGDSALYKNITGSGNTALGSAALKAATGGSNTAIGAFAGNAITTGTGNTVLGSLPGTAALANTVLVGTGSSAGTAADGTEYMRIQPKTSGVDPTAGIKGLVGINNTNPQYALDVTGETRISNIPTAASTTNVLISNNGVVNQVPLSVINGGGGGLTATFKNLTDASATGTSYAVYLTSISNTSASDTNPYYLINASDYNMWCTNKTNPLDIVFPDPNTNLGRMIRVTEQNGTKSGGRFVCPVNTNMDQAHGATGGSFTTINNTTPDSFELISQKTYLFQAGLMLLPGASTPYAYWCLILQV